jgi:hypothetical protein
MVALARDSRLAGLLVRLVNFQFALAIGPRDHRPLSDGVFRPKEIIVPTPSGKRILAISWEHPGDAKGAVLRWQPQTPTQ